MATGILLDSWPVLGWRAGEPAASRAFTTCLVDAREGRQKLFISVINLGEVFYTEARRHGAENARDFVRVLSSWAAILPAPDPLVMAAAELKARFPVSYADAFALATALDRGLPLLTGDPELVALASRIPRLRLEAIG